MGWIHTPYCVKRLNGKISISPWIIITFLKEKWIQNSLTRRKKHWNPQVFKKDALPLWQGLASRPVTWKALGQYGIICSTIHITHQLFFNLSLSGKTVFTFQNLYVLKYGVLCYEIHWDQVCEDFCMQVFTEEENHTQERYMVCINGKKCRCS